MVEALRDKGADIFQDAGKNPSTAVLLYYINSGCLEFQEWKEYDAMQDGQEYDMEALCQEIRNEQLLEMEIASLIEQWERITCMYNKISLPVELVEFVRWRVHGWCT